MRNIIASLAVIAMAVLTNGCGSGPLTPQTPSSPPSITTQPTSKSVALGEPATFSVAATGSGPLAYQWFWNGMKITANANGPSITLPPAVASDDQTNLSVTVSNDFGTVTSMAVTLSVPGSPRRAAAWDLRFKDIGAFPVSCGGGIHTNILPALSTSYKNNIGLPFELGSSDGQNWFYSAYLLPTGAPERTTAYQSGILDALSSDFSTLSADPTIVITSLSVVAAQNVYAVETVKTALEDIYTPAVSGAVPTGNLQAVATNEGLAGHVITALSLSGGQAYYISYGRRGDNAVYESSVASATLDTISAVAADLAQRGFFLTAVGGDKDAGFLLVGTKVQGDITPRPFAVTDNVWPGRGFTPVASIFDYGTGKMLIFFEQ